MRTLAEELTILIQDKANNNPPPITTTITKTYTDNHADVRDNNNQVYRYVPVIGEKILDKEGVLIFLNGDLNTPLLLSPTNEMITIDSELSGTSVNPVQNKVINTALGNKVDKESGKGLFSGSYTDLTNKPSIPSASSTTPSADVSGGAIGSATTWAKADHQHPLSSAYATNTHSHSISDVTNLQSSLDGKSSTGHSHTWTEVSSSTTAPTTYHLYVNSAIRLAELIIAHKNPNSYSGSTSIGLNVGASYVPLGIAVRMTNKENIRLGVATNGDVYIYGSVNANTNVQASIMWHY